MLCQEGGCGQASSSTAEILGSLGRAVTGYIPIVSMLGDQVRVTRYTRDTLYTILMTRDTDTRDTCVT